MEAKPEIHNGHKQTPCSYCLTSLLLDLGVMNLYAASLCKVSHLSQN
jgi:hypothetical protein